jgi:catechol 2,3-dioxygenase-like lactoylglutathione lyase family enzyme
VPTRDLEAAVEFYGSTVGLPRSVCIRDRNYAEFETGNLTLSVFDPEQFGLEHMAFFADPDGNALMPHHRYAPRVTNAQHRGAPEAPSLALSRGCDRVGGEQNLLAHLDCEELSVEATVRRLRDFR